MKRVRAALAVVGLVLGGGCSAAPPAASPLTVVADVPLPGDTSRFDYESLDAERHRLFIAHLGASEVLAFDTQTRTVVGRVPNLSHVHGVLVVSAIGRVFASATGTDEVVVLDEETLAVVARVPGGRYPDGMAYAPDVHKLYVSDETGETETVIDTATNVRVATVPLGGEVGNSQYDPITHHVFVNVQSRRELVEIDPATDTITARTELPGARGNHGLLIEARQGLAFVACEGNDKLLVVDLGTRKVLQTFDVGSGPDVLAEDEDRGLVYVATESGAVNVFRATNGRVEPVAAGTVAPNAHVVAVDPATHSLYLPIKNMDGHPALRIATMSTNGINPPGP